MLIMLMSMKSQPSFCPATPFSFIACFTALVNFFTCWVAAGPAAPLIQANEWRMFFFGIHGEWRSIWKPRSPCSNRIGRPSPHSMA